MKPIIPLFLGVTLVAAAAADETSVAPAAEPSTLGLSVSLGGSFSGKTKLKSGSRPAGEVSSAEFDHEASYEFDLPNGATLSVGHSLHGSYFELPEHNVATALPKRLQSAQVELAYSQSWNDRVNAFVSLSPGLRWAGSDTGAGSFGVGGGAGAFYRYSDTLSLMLGVGFDSMAHHKVMPGVGVQWAPSERWSVSFGFPRTAVTCNVSESLSLSLVAEGVSDTYHIEKDPLPALAGKPSLADTKLEYEDCRIGLSAEYRLSPRCSFTATAGCVVSREYDYFERHYKVKSDEAAAYGSLALAVKF